MKNIFKIYKRDIVTIATNWAALTMIVVLMIVPSLYSLINIKASWDPYGNTAGIKVAIINEDKGAVFKEQDINLGKELVEKLQDNDKMGWTFVDKETGEKGLLQEKYYATIEIPEDFSESVTTLVGKNVSKPKLKYTVNEKKNAIAPKMTDAGLNSLKGQIDDNIVKTVSGLMFRICSEVGVEVDNNRSELRKIVDAVYELEDNIPELEKILDSAIDGTTELSNLLVKANEIMPTVSDTIDSTDSFLKDNQEFLDKTQDGLSDISPIIKEDLVMSENILDTTSIQLANLDENILPEVAKKTLIMVLDTANATDTSIDEVKSKLKNIKKFLDKVSDIKIQNIQTDENEQNATQSSIIKDETKKQIKSLKNIQENLKDISKRISSIIDKLDIIGEKLDILIDRVDAEIDRLDNGGTLDMQTLTDVRKIIDDVHTLVSDIVDSYDSEIVPIVQDGINGIREVLENGVILLEQGRDTLPDVEKLLSVVTETTDLSNDELNKLKGKLPDIKQKVNDLADELREIDEEDKFDELLDLLNNNWEDQSSFLSSPVEIEDNRLFSWPNYGSTATPFYTVLCLWVGGLLASTLLSLEAPEFEEGESLKAYEIYLGKLLVFLSLGICQAIIASTGALWILGSYAAHPVMYVFFSMFVSTVFITIIYTAASVLDDVGKALIVVALVLQMAGTSGNFPIEVTPSIFQKLYPYLPFTYATNGMRQIMAGIVYPILLKDIAILCIYIIVALIFGLLFKNVIGKTTTKLMKKLGESGILRH